MKIGDILTKENYTQGAIWCNKNNAHIEKQGKKYIIVENTSPAPTKEELLSALEAEFLAGQGEYALAINVAQMNDDTELVEELKAEYQGFVEAYAEQKREIEGSEG